MITRFDLKKQLKNMDNVEYDEGDGFIYFNGDINYPIKFEDFYQQLLKKLGMSFNCICDMHFECMSIIECTECGTVIKYMYDEDYDPNFKCPTCTGYKTGFEFYTKEQIEASEELQAIVDTYKEFEKNICEQYERKKQRNNLNDWELYKPFDLTIGNNVYRFQLEIDSITNKNKLQGLILKISKLEKEKNGIGMTYKSYKIIPLSREAYHYYKYVLHELKEHPELNPLEQLKGKPLSESMEEAAVRRLKQQKE